MATLQSRTVLNLPSGSYMARRKINCCRATLHVPSDLSPKGVPSFANLSSMVNLDKLRLREKQSFRKLQPLDMPRDNGTVSLSKLQAIADAVADRVEMHDIIGTQRNNWNHLFLHSINTFNLSASLMAGIASSFPANLLAFKLSSVLLFSTAAGMMMIVNKIQPSQLAEEQRNATRLWKQLGREIQHELATKGSLVAESDVHAAMDKVLALDKAYPLPLTGSPGMLEKFPDQVEPTCWWPRKPQKQVQKSTNQKRFAGNGWSKELEAEMTGLLNVLKMKDESDYIDLGRLALSINKGLAISGPLFAGLAAIATAFVSSSEWGPVVGVVGGTLAAVVNTLEHGGQIGMIFELFRNLGGYYRRLEEEIEYNLSEREPELRENGEVFAMKMALQLGRSVSDLKEFAAFASPSCKAEDVKDVAGKLF